MTFSRPNLRLEVQPDGVAVLWLDVPGRAMNTFSRAVLADLDAALDHIAVDPSARLLVVRSAKPSGFLAGADLHEFTAVQSADDARALSEQGQKLFDKLAGLRVPSVAVVHGPCLGGGLEFALACDYRLVVDQPGTQLGLPEIELGLVPAWGGTQRLPRVVGLERALQVILAGRRLGARDAFRWKLADALAPPEPHLATVLGSMLKHAFARGKRQRSGLARHTWRQALLETTGLGRRTILGGFERVLRRRVPDDMPAPAEALECVRVGLAEGMAAGLAREREAIGRLAMTPACRNLVNLFFQREKARKLPGDATRGTPSIRKVGVVGAGTMGAGIAQLAAIRGCEVFIQEANPDALGAGMVKVAALFDKAVQRRLLARAEADKRLSAIKGTLTWEGFRDVEIAVEAVVEDLDAKRAVFRELEQHTKADAVLATNTSSLLVRQVQEGLSHPGRVAGLHFFNPVHKMPLVEVARNAATADRAVRALTAWAVALGKTPVVILDSPGFVVNRILTPYLNEAVLLLVEGMPVEQVDEVMVRFGMPMGPLELLDQVGLDVASHIAKALQPVFGVRIPPNPAFAEMVGAEWLGHKNGWGFYRYQGSVKKVNQAAPLRLREGRSESAAALLEALPPAVRSQQARDRMVLLMVNEAAACLGEGIAADAATVDLAMVLGTGWAPHRGGPLRYAADRGHAEVAQALEDLARRLGPRFEPSAELRRLAVAEPRASARGAAETPR